MSQNKSWPPAPTFQPSTEDLPKSPGSFASLLSRSLGVPVALVGLFLSVGVKWLFFPELWQYSSLPHDPVRYGFSVAVGLLIAGVGADWSVRNIVCTLKCLQRDGRLSDSFLFLGSIGGLLLNCLSVLVAFSMPYVYPVLLH